MTSGRIGFGIVGCGTIADFHAKAIGAVEGAGLVAVHDVREESARRLGEAESVPWFTDLKEFLAEPELEVVAIATPSGSHLEPAVAAAKAGKHVICEKPLEVTLERCDRMINTFKKAKRLLAGIFPLRAGDGTMALRGAVDSGRFGRVTAIEARVPWYRTQEYYDSGQWRGTWELDGGGALMNQSIHNLDVFQWLGGPVESVAAVADRLIHSRIKVEDVAAAAVRFRSGAVGTIFGTTAAYPGSTREVGVYGEKGTAVLRDDYLVQFEFAEPGPEDEGLVRREGAPGAGSSDPRAISYLGHQRQFEDFARCVRERKEPMVDGAEARKAVELILSIYKSAQTGKFVRLPLARTPPRLDMKSAASGLRRKAGAKKGR